MRLWPYQMLDVLPRMQMLSQWRECLAVGGMLGAKTLNHATVNRVKDYPIEHFMVYCDLVRREFANRGWTIGTNTLEKLKNDIGYETDESKRDFDYCGDEDCDGKYQIVVNRRFGMSILFDSFHDERYLKQCLYSFQEKYDCGMLTDEEWNKIVDKFDYLIER